MSNSLEPRVIFKNTQILFYALVGGQLLFMTVVMWLLGKYPGLVFLDESNTWIVLAFSVSILGIIGSHLVDGYLRRQPVKRDQLLFILNHYRNRVVMRSAILEGANLLNIVLFFGSGGSTWYFMLYVVVMGMFLLKRPREIEILSQYTGYKGAGDL